MNGGVHAVAARRVFDGMIVREDAAVMIDGDTIAAVVPRLQVATGTPVHDLPENAWLAPGFIDIQVNGGGDVLFNDTPTPAAIRAIIAAHRKFGTTALLPTLISDSAEKMAAAMAAVESLVGVEPAVLGIHLEGPFLSPAKPGVHDPRALRRPSAEDRATLAASHKGAIIVTLAPEEVPAPFITELAAAGVRISLGHSMATYAQTQAAMAAGVTGFTHLFNAMRPLEAREPGPIAAALEVGASLVRNNRRWRACRAADAALGVARRRPSDFGHRCDAARERQTVLIHAQRRDHHRARRPLHNRRRNACRRLSRHGRRGAQLRSVARRTA